MTNEEFSNEFDVLLNSYAQEAKFNDTHAQGSIALNEYEKSVFLTKAQEEIVKNYFNGKGNKYGEGFDGSMKRQIDFSGITQLKIIDNPSEPSFFDPRARSLNIDVSDIIAIVNEQATGIRDFKIIPLVVIPINHSEYDRAMSKSYKYPLKWQVWRIAFDDRFEILAPPETVISQYRARVIKRPEPIILSDFSEVSIDGKNSATECKLDPVIHRDILQRAVELALGSFGINLNSAIELGKRSE